MCAFSTPLSLRCAMLATYSSLGSRLFSPDAVSHHVCRLCRWKGACEYGQAVGAYAANGLEVADAMTPDNLATATQDAGEKCGENTDKEATVQEASV